MRSEEHRVRLRAAVARGDSRSLVTLLREGTWPEHALQLVGDGLLGALAARTDGADAQARRCGEALRERDWSGDAELADSLSAGLGTGPVPLLRPLPVDLEELAGVLEGDPLTGGGRIDLRSGDVWPQSAIEYAQEAGDIDQDDIDEQRWLPVKCEGSRAGYRDMELFLSAVEDPDQGDRLSIAIGGRGAFRRFKDVLPRWPDLLERWYAFSDDRPRGRARAWLAAEGYTPAPKRART